MTGSSQATGQKTQSKTSYLRKEILWGHRFVNINTYDHLENAYVVDYDKFDETEQVYFRRPCITFLFTFLLLYFVG